MNLGMPEMIFIFLLALIIFGPRKLPEIGRQLGKAMADFKRASNEFKSQLEDEIRQIEVLEEQEKAEKAQLAQQQNAPPPTILPPANTMHAELPVAVAPEGVIARDAIDHAALSQDTVLEDIPARSEPMQAEPFDSAQGATPRHDG